jgi:heme-degrading monooxygenase HmoA
MPTITVTVNTIKPSNKDFFPENSLENLALIRNIQAWNASQPGFVSETFVDQSADHRVTTTVWDSIENYEAWRSASQVHPDKIIRNEYNDANGIVSSVSEIIN